MNNLTIFAHRGAGGTEPENTLRSFRRALELGAEWVELDVHLVENSLIVFHDDHLDRRTNGTGLVADRSLAYIRSLDAGEGEKIPLLGEVMDMLAGRAGVNVELKGDRTALPAAGLLSERIRSGKWKPDRILVSSFNHSELAGFKSHCPDIPIGALFKEIPSDLDWIKNILGCYSVHLARNHVEAGTVNAAHDLGMKVFVYTVNRMRDAERMKTMEVDGVFTDYPERFLRKCDAPVQ
jgi:glycerophosphoryl diester phosphodiesterase